MSHPLPAPLPSGKQRYAPFKPHPAIEKRSNLAKIVSLVDSRADRDQDHDDLESSDSHSDLGSNETINSDKSEDENIANRLDEMNASAAKAIGFRSPAASSTIEAASCFPMPPASPATLPFADRLDGPAQQHAAQHISRSSSKKSDHTAVSSPELTDKKISRILLRDSRLAPALDTATSINGNVVDQIITPRAVESHASDGGLIESVATSPKHLDTNDLKQPFTVRGQLRSEPTPQLSALNGESSVPLPGRTHKMKSDDGHSSFGPSGLREITSFSNVSDWIPVALPAGRSRIHNLPAWDNQSQNDVPRSTHNQHINRDIDSTMRKLMSEDLFGRFLDDPLGKHRFRDFLSRTHYTSITKLDMLTDLLAYAKTMHQLKVSSEALHDLYLAEDSPDHVQDVTSLAASELIETLRSTFHLPVSTDSFQSCLLKSLYQNEFQRFIKKQLVEETKVRLGKLDLGDDRTGLGDCFCLTNPRLKENPIVLVSDGFEILTGYPAQAVIGYNCRFLQSAGTSAESVQRVRDALTNGVGICEILLNYRKDGTPFWNLLNIIPLRDTDGRLVYFLAGQIEITGALASSKGLGFLLGGAGSGDDMKDVRDRFTINGNDLSPTMSRYLRARENVDEEGAFQSVQGSDYGDRRDSGAVPAFRRDPIKSDAGRSIGRSGASGASDSAQTHHESRNNDQIQRRRDHPSSTVGSDFNGRAGVSIIDRMTNKFRARNAASIPSSMSSQQIGGAETTLRRGTFNLDDQMTYFSDVYSKVIVFKRHKREIIFVTPELLSFLGHRTATNKETYNSSLIHIDLLSLICGSDNVETKALRASVKEAVKAGKEFSMMTCVKVRTARGAGLGFTNAAARVFKSTNDSLGFNGTDQDLLNSGHAGQDRRYVTIHLTPLKDSKKACFAFVGIIA